MGFDDLIVRFTLIMSAFATLLFMVVLFRAIPKFDWFMIIISLGVIPCMILQFYKSWEFKVKSEGDRLYQIEKCKEVS